MLLCCFFCLSFVDTTQFNKKLQMSASILDLDIGTRNLRKSLWFPFMQLSSVYWAHYNLCTIKVHITAMHKYKKHLTVCFKVVADVMDAFIS